jgi:hypothetical protein
MEQVIDQLEQLANRSEQLADRLGENAAGPSLTLVETDEQDADA